MKSNVHANYCVELAFIEHRLDRCPVTEVQNIITKRIQFSPKFVFYLLFHNSMRIRILSQSNLSSKKFLRNDLIVYMQLDCVNS